MFLVPKTSIIIPQTILYFENININIFLVNLNFFFSTAIK